MAENKKATDIIATLEKFFKQAPNLPINIREVLVNIMPWLALIFGVLSLVVGLGALGLSPIALLGGINASFVVLVSGVVALVSGVLMFMAYRKLDKKQYKGWELLFWAEAVSVISAIMTVNIGSVLSVLIGFYLLFQIKNYYK